jgi:SAM-dependent methyltransferase
MPASGAGEIAAAAGLPPPAVRDWLDVMASGGLLQHDPGLDTYHLPREYVPALTRASGADIGALAACVAGLGAFEDQVVAHLRADASLPEAVWPVPAFGPRAPAFELTTPPLLEAVLPLIPGLAADLHRGIDVLEVGCGSARGLNMLAESFPNSRFTGLDPDADQLALAAAEAGMLGLTNAVFHTVDPQALAIEGRYDLIAVAPAPVRSGGALDAAARALRASGTLIIESDLRPEHGRSRLASPLSPLLHTLACVRSLCPEAAAPPQDDPVARLRAAGFRRIRIERPAHALKTAVVIARRH